MNDWLVINLGDAMLVYEQQQQLESLLFSAYKKAGEPADMAAFIRHESAGRLHCEVKLYISPQLAAAVNVEGAQACPKPKAQDLGLLVGDVDAWLALFPATNGI